MTHRAARRDARTTPRAIKQVFDEHALAAFGEVAMAEEEIRSWFAMPNIWMQLAERDGQVVGYLDITSEESGHLSVDARTLDAEVAPVLLEAGAGARTRACERRRFCVGSSRVTSRCCGRPSRPAGGR